MYDDVILNEYGFYTLKNLPTDEEREAYYKDQYYQTDSAGYTVHYTLQEMNMFNAKLEQKLLLVDEHLCEGRRNYAFLDIGCGEGFAVAFFKQKGFSVLGLDYSSAGLKNHNPDVVEDVMIGDVYDSIDDLINRGRQFDVINMDNLLEHVTDPLALLEQTYSLMQENGIAIIKVPNDFSVLQQYFIENGIMDKPHWIAPLDHISYFNKDGLINLCKVAGLECVDFAGDSLVEFFALNPDTNYFKNKSVGKSCHLARVAQENIFHDVSPEKTLKLLRVFGEMGIGRQMTGVFKKQAIK